MFQKMEICLNLNDRIKTEPVLVILVPADGQP